MALKLMSKPLRLIIPKLLFIQSLMILFSIKKHLELGNSYVFLLNWGEIKMMLQPFVPLAWFVYIFGVYGSIGLEKEEKGVNVHVMEVCMTRLQERPLQDLQRFNPH